jgi:hypothetical protein
MMNPLPMWRRSSRWWFLKSVGRLLTSGMTRVEVRTALYDRLSCSSALTFSRPVVHRFLALVCTAPVLPPVCLPILNPCPIRDQFCSLVFTLSNLYFVGCVYRGDFVEGPQRCSSLRAYWPVTFLLSALPLFVRLVQSLRRYADSRLITHLINVRSCHYRRLAY